MERLLYKPKIKKLFNLKESGIWYLKANGSIYFLETIKNESISLLRKAMGSFNYHTNHKKPLFKQFIKEISEDYDNQVKITKKIGIKKKGYYSKMRIQRKTIKIERLQEEIKKEKINLNKLIRKNE